MEQEKSNIEELVKDLLSKIDIDAQVTVEEVEGGYKVAIDAGDNNALLIGKHGNTLTALEHILFILAAKKRGEAEDAKRITIEIGGYRAEREAYLADLAGRLKQEVIETGNEKTVRGLKPWERRHVHMVLAEDADVMTESEGEDRDRVLVIKKKT